MLLCVGGARGDSGAARYVGRLGHPSGNARTDYQSVLRQLSNLFSHGTLLVRVNIHGTGRDSMPWRRGGEEENRRCASIANGCIRPLVPACEPVYRQSGSITNGCIGPHGPDCEAVYRGSGSITNGGSRRRGRVNRQSGSITNGCFHEMGGTRLGFHGVPRRADAAPLAGSG
jgi:hypothetical protein